MERGYFALWRKFQEHPFWKERRVFSKAEAWIDILWEAQHDEETRQVVIGMHTLECHYGECLKSNRTWAKRWGWAEARVRRFLNLLVEMNQIHKTNEIQTTRISICNYRHYDPKMTQERRTSDARSTTDKNVKNVKKERTSTQIDFDTFWSAYPKKKSKQDALKAWKVAKKSNNMPPLPDILKTIEALKKTDQWKKDAGQFIPYPASWIRAGGWEDEVKTDDAPPRRRDDAWRRSLPEIYKGKE